MPRRSSAIRQQDVYPQYYGFSRTLAVAGTTETFELVLPISRQATGSAQQAQVIEILSVNWRVPGPPPVGNPAETGQNYYAFITTRNHGTVVPELDENDIIDWYGAEFQGAFTAAGTYGVYVGQNEDHDITDHEGHGVLVGTDRLYIQVSGSATFAVTCQFRILYRFRLVPLAEYIGMIQSQQ